MIKVSLKKNTDMYSSIIYWVSKLFSTELKKDLFHKSNDYTHKVYLWPHSVPSIHLSILWHQHIILITITLCNIPGSEVGGGARDWVLPCD